MPLSWASSWPPGGQEQAETRAQAETSTMRNERRVRVTLRWSDLWCGPSGAPRSPSTMRQQRPARPAVSPKGPPHWAAHHRSLLPRVALLRVAEVRWPAELRDLREPVGAGERQRHPLPQREELRRPHREREALFGPLLAGPAGRRGNRGDPVEL
eukprot:9503904-Pyramimonas_sp.AAC.1